MDISCPGCNGSFDPESHAPFLGSCSHSLCAVCVNEKNIKVCPVCSADGAFAAKQRNTLAADLLAVLMKTTDNYQVPAILQPKCHSFLAPIINQLDPRSFANLARTCKKMHEICYNSEEIKIDYVIPWILVSTTSDSIRFRMKDAKGMAEGHEFLPVDYVNNDFGFLSSSENRKKLPNYPFNFVLKCLYIKGALGSGSIAQIRLLMGEFQIKSIAEIHTERIDDWPGFVQFTKDFHIKEVDCRFVSMLQRIMYMGIADALLSGPPSISEETAAYFLKHTEYFHCNVFIPDKLILNAPVKRVRLTKTEISKNTFVNLLKRFSNSTEDVKWRLGCDDDFDFGHYSVFKTIGCRHKGSIPAKRPLILKTSDKDCFKVLRKDGKYLLVYQDGSNVVFSTTSNQDEEPDYDEYDTDDELPGELEDYEDSDDYDESADDFGSDSDD